MKQLSAILFFVFLILGCMNKTGNNSQAEIFKVFNGVEASDSGYKIIDTPLSSNQQKAALVSTLVYYGIPARFDGDTISIPESSFKDMNYLYNITIKAKDSAWLIDHIIPNK